MPNRFAPNKRLGKLRHRDRGHEPAINSRGFESILQSERVDHRGEHSHLIALHAADAFRASRDAAKDISAADHNSNLDSHCSTLHNIGRELSKHFRIDTIFTLTHERLARKLEEDSFIARFRT